MWSRWASSVHTSRRGTASLAAITTALETRITPAVAHALARDGYAVVDNLLDTPATAALHREVVALHAGGHMTPNATHLVTGGKTQLLEKRGVFEAEGHALSAAATAPLLKSLATDRTLLTLLTIYGEGRRDADLVGQVLKIQYNAGNGACFPMHCDTDSELDGRRVSALFYLQPSWKPDHGGELVLFPHPAAKAVTLAPLGGRCVLFSAVDMLHRVMPSAVPRACFTLWLFARHHGARPVMDGASEPGIEHKEASLEAMWAVPHLRRFVQKAVHRDAWAQSIREAHPDTPAREAALQALFADVAVIETVLERRFAGARQLLEQLRRTAPP
jgi:hypothetical protein